MRNFFRQINVDKFLPIAKSMKSLDSFFCIFPITYMGLVQSQQIMIRPSKDHTLLTIELPDFYKKNQRVLGNIEKNEGSEIDPLVIFKVHSLGIKMVVNKVSRILRSETWQA